MKVLSIGISSVPSWKETEGMGRAIVAPTAYSHKASLKEKNKKIGFFLDLRTC